MAHGDPPPTPDETIAALRAIRDGGVFTFTTIQVIRELTQRPYEVGAPGYSWNAGVGSMLSSWAKDPSSVPIPEDLLFESKGSTKQRLGSNQTTTTEVWKFLTPPTGVA